MPSDSFLMPSFCHLCAVNTNINVGYSILSKPSHTCVNSDVRWIRLEAQISNRCWIISTPNRLNSNRNSSTKSEMHCSTSTKKSRREKMTFSIKWIESFKWTSSPPLPSVDEINCKRMIAHGGIQVAHEGEVPNAIKKIHKESLCFLKDLLALKSNIPEFKIYSN